MSRKPVRLGVSDDAGAWNAHRPGCGDVGGNPVGTAWAAWAVRGITR
jgi:hypothetical protein